MITRRDEEMTRERFLGRLLGFALLPLAGCSDPVALDDAPPELVKSDDEWRALLSAESFAVLFQEATEVPGTSPLNDEHRDGTFICAACFNPLFLSSAKYDSGTGWPSFWELIDGRLGFKRDFTIGVERIEYHCRRCGGHQGHVFDDGPPPTGKRYCNNGVALQFVPAGQALPQLRT